MPRRSRNIKQSRKILKSQCLSRKIRPRGEIVILRAEDDTHRQDFVLQSWRRSHARGESVVMHDIAALRFQFHSWRPKRHDYDYLVVTSPRVVESLARTVKGGRRLRVETVLMIGPQTCIAFRRCFRGRKFWKDIVVVSPANRQGIMRRLKRAKGFVLYPHSSLVEPWLKTSCRSPLLTVEELVAYRSLGARIRRPLKKVFMGSKFPSSESPSVVTTGPLLVLVTSPSLFQVLRRSFLDEEIKRRKPLFLTLGSTTRDVIAAAGFSVRQASKPSLTLALREALFYLHQRARSPKTTTQ